MAITTATIAAACASQPLLFHHRTNSFHHRVQNTLFLSPPTTARRIPLLRYRKPSLIRTTAAALLPIQPHHLLSLSSPTKQTFSSALALFLAFAKTLAAKVVVSVHEFREPLVAVANAAGKWVELYHSVLMVRILLSWFPNMPWEKQPFSAIRDLCDPCLSFFQTILPPKPPFDKFDVSPLLAFTFLGVLGNFLKAPLPPPPI